MAQWTEFDTFTAPNPIVGKDPLRLILSPELVHLQSSLGKVSVIYQAWCHLMGKLPPINNIGKVESSLPPVSLTTLHNSIACYCGLMRPHDTEKSGSSVLVYVLNPRVSLEYSVSMVCLARQVIVPLNTVLTVQVRPNFPLQQENNGIDGTVTRLEFVVNDERDTRLPRGYDTRYEKAMWVNKNE